jgi:hypothetical protein
MTGLRSLYKSNARPISSAILPASSPEIVFFALSLSMKACDTCERVVRGTDYQAADPIGFARARAREELLYFTTKDKC